MKIAGVGDLTFQVEADVQQNGREIDVLTTLSILGQSTRGRFVGEISDSGEFTYGTGRSASGIPQCGDFLRTAMTMKFSGKTLRWTGVAETESCADIIMDGTLSRP